MRDEQSHTDALVGDPIPPSSLQAVLDQLVDSGAIETSTRNRGQTWLAEQVDVSPQTVRRWISGDRRLKGASAVAVRAVIRGVL